MFAAHRIMIIMIIMMIAAVLLAIALPPEESRTYHRVTVAQVAATQWTHVSVCGTVALVKHEADGDTHIRLEDGRAFIVAEFVPYHPLARPALRQLIRVEGISRDDKTHGWAEVHPVESWRQVSSCGAQ